MAPVSIGLAGFGRIGRSLFRLLYDRIDLCLAAVSDATDPETLSYLLRFDTLAGRFPHPLTIRDGKLEVRGRTIRHFVASVPGEVPWGDLGVEVVIETSTKARSRAEFERHLAQGAKRVILCVPPADPPDLTVVNGINDHLLTPEHRIISSASTTAHCAAPLVKILGDAFGIERLYLSTVHAYTDQQRLADVPEKDLRRGRAAAENIIPQESNAGHLLEELFPNLAGRVVASSMNVPIANGSLIDLVCWHRCEVSRDAVNEAVRAAAGTPALATILAYETEPIVSSDVINSPYSAVFDSDATMVLGRHMSKTLAWFDNSWGHAHRVIELITRSRELTREAA